MWLINWEGIIRILTKILGTKHIEYKDELIIIVNGPIMINSINISVKWQDHNQFIFLPF